MGQYPDPPSRSSWPPPQRVDVHIYLRNESGLTVGRVNIGGASQDVIDKALGPNPRSKLSSQKAGNEPAPPTA